MARTTPARPLDLAARYPRIVAFARPAVRLHPRRGAPTVTDSSIGGPLRWPASESWPTCAEHLGRPLDGTPPEAVHTRRRIITEAWLRDPERGPNDDERAQLADMPDEQTVICDGPVPMVAVAQLYAADVPELPFPTGSDVLQVLWCPFEHPDDYEPRIVVAWRAAAAIDPAGVVVPAMPAVVDEGYLPEPCDVHPEVVTEYPQDLPPKERGRYEDWALEHGWEYQYDLSVAPGCKAGGHAPWGATDPVSMACATCGSEVVPLLTLDSSEWDGGTQSWRPIEDGAAGDEPMFASAASSTELMIGRSQRLQLYVCSASAQHPVIQNLQ